MLVKVWVTLKEGVLDPQGTTIQHTLACLGTTGIEEVKVGKYFELRLAETNSAAAQEKITRICQDMLSNPVIENYRYEIS